MPELPEVETVRRGLNRVTLHQPIKDLAIHLERTIAYPASSADFCEGLRGKAIAQWHRRGKYLLAELGEPGITPPVPPKAEPSTAILSSSVESNAAVAPVLSNSSSPSGGWLGVHLRMTGQLLWLCDSEPFQTHCRVQLFFADGKELRFVDQRTFGQMWWVPPACLPDDIITGLQRLGPEPFSEAFSCGYLKHELARRHRPIKNALLDQSIVAGLGNIYADESLFLSGIHPTTWCDRISAASLDHLHRNIIQVLNTSIMEGGTTFSDFRDVKGINGNYGQLAWVYGQTGKPCRVCNTAIERLKLAGRSTHFCPRCQKS